MTTDASTPIAHSARIYLSEMEGQSVLIIEADDTSQDDGTRTIAYACVTPLTRKLTKDRRHFTLD